MQILDQVVLVVYFALSVGICFYGCHRLVLLYLYVKHRGKRLHTPHEIQQWPTVTIQLPMFNEQFVAARLIDAVCRLDYPRDLMQIQVLDDSTDDTVEIVRQKVEEKRREGFQIESIHRTDRTGYKAGALSNGIKTACGEYIIIFDADFLPRQDFLRKTLPYFGNPRVALVQSRWDHINRDYSLLTEVQALILDAHFVIEQEVRYASGRFFHFNGTAGVWRKSAILDAGGWEHDTLTEDLDLSYRAQMKGWQFVYVPEVTSPAELPIEVPAFKTQQHRWTKGFIESSRKLLPEVFAHPSLPLWVKIEAFFHLTANLAYPMALLLSMLMLPVYVIRMDASSMWGIPFEAPLFSTVTFSVLLFLAVPQVMLGLKRRAGLAPLVLGVMNGMMVNNARAVLEALLGHKSEFVRTPKYDIRIGKSERKTSRTFHSTLVSAQPYFEFLMTVYFAVQLLFCVWYGLWEIAPFVGLFLFGFGYVTLGSFQLLLFKKAGEVGAASADASSPELPVA